MVSCDSIFGANQLSDAQKTTELSAENKSAPQGYQTRGNPAANTNPTDADSRHPDWSQKTLLPSPLKIRRQQLTSTSNQIVSPTPTPTALADTGNSYDWRNAYGTKYPANKGESHQYHNPADRHNTEADFDAALDAAVEAVYDDGLEPYTHQQGELRDATDYNSKDVKREDEKDIVANGANDPRDMPHQQHSAWQDSNTWRKSTSTMSATRSGPSMSAEDQERFLAGFSKDFSHGSFMNGSAYGSTTTSSLPRQSNSSGFSGGTWASSVASSLTTIGTSQSAVEESVFGDLLAGEARQSYLPPLPHYDFRTSQILNSKDSAQSIVTAVAETSPNPDEQDQETSHGRRLSTRNAKQSTIDTGAQSDSLPAAGSVETFTQSSVAPAAINNPRNPARRIADDVDAKDTDAEASSVLSHRFASSPLPQSLTARDQPAREAPPPDRLKTAPSGNGRFASHQSVSTDHLPVGATTKSFNANRSETIGGSPELSQLGFVYNDQPGHSGFQHAQHQPHSPLVSTPISCDPSGARIFAHDVHNDLEASDSRAADVPVSLEPCPDMTLLRPFWLMRCLSQTLTNSRGGYLSSRLFIPRDVWKVKNVKLKNLDDKIANCHLLTSALLRLRPVSLDDAETLLTAMQVFDTVLDQVKANLGKRLGGDVGPQSLGSLYKDAALASPTSDSGGQVAGGGGEGASGTSRSGGAGTGGKSFLGSSWRKMRSKDSNTSLGRGTAGARDAGQEAGGHMASIPMSSAAGAAGRQTASAELHRETSSRAVEMTGPNAGYANALIRLFDAAGVLGESCFYSFLVFSSHPCPPLASLCFLPLVPSCHTTADPARHRRHRAPGCRRAAAAGDADARLARHDCAARGRGFWAVRVPLRAGRRDAAGGQVLQASVGVVAGVSLGRSGEVERGVWRCETAGWGWVESRSGLVPVGLGWNGMGWTASYWIETGWMAKDPLLAPFFAVAVEA